MAIDTSMNNSNVTTGEQAKAVYNASKASQKIGQQTTDRGTLVVSSRNLNATLNQNSFIKLMAAQMKNLDPSENTDNTQYITQMAQFSTMEQTRQLNNTMTQLSYQDLIGKAATFSTLDSNGENYVGIIRGTSYQNNTWYVSAEVCENGENKIKLFSADSINGTIERTDYTSNAMAINSDFSAASSLAANKENKAVIVDKSDAENVKVIKGRVKSVFLDNGVVKVRVSEFDENGNEKEDLQVFPYGYLYRAGDLTDEDMDVKAEDFIENESAQDSADVLNDPTNPNYDAAAKEAQLASSKVSVVTGQNGLNDSTVNDQYDEDIKKLKQIQGD
ncbi:flagellar hook capping FlgD N-terminal domain-containing protein [Clostridium sp. BJN0001]|uniref:flagellar hook assembly protein FlgD n=1 Tax=Clostridium sp. BJN0001 TaxID=2930219 RepID=UPI001FD24A3F|nr:flagellar hook capping FlgD N-terminal domain-containing protein [Clostridium sp. BJN0001]